MSDKHYDISNDEVRIITSAHNPKLPHKKKSKHGRLLKYASIICGLLIIAAIIILWSLKFSPQNDDKLKTPSGVNPEATAVTETQTVKEGSGVSNGYVSISDTVINNQPFTIYEPVNLTPILKLGKEVLTDKNNKFILQAADVRGDNGQIVGAFVKEGELLAKGQSKSGFCAIIDGQITIGVADATPLLEKALETNGYFFRQYPLVVGGQIIENKPKGKSFRKALAEKSRRIIIVMSAEKMTFHDFSQSLVDMGVSTAIYLVGSTAHGYAIDIKGEHHYFGEEKEHSFQNVNYLVWK